MKKKGKVNREMYQRPNLYQKRKKKAMKIQ
ncbi:Uncharacterised protein [Peptoniphilus harei]|uniref:Uncharacterized protein n=1 Tax=Peptoniphilus harei TaxID=54005 RepID=A0A2X1XUW6_9FIRM|nr:Uncharacterised protein [Peptoniphilus harei]